MPITPDTAPPTASTAPQPPAEADGERDARVRAFIDRLLAEGEAWCETVQPPARDDARKQGASSK